MVNELRDRVHNLEGAPQRESSIIVPSVNIVFFYAKRVETFNLRTYSHAECNNARSKED